MQKMSIFDSLLDKVWQIARNEEDFLTAFARLTCDRERVAMILALPQLQDFCVTDGFSGKCETLAEELRLRGDKLNLETAASTIDPAHATAKQALELYTSAIRVAPQGSMSLARSYKGRVQVLLRTGDTDLALRDVKRALGFQLPPEDAIKLLSLAASCHQHKRAWDQAEKVLQEALDKLRNSELENNVKASMTGEIISQLKTINHEKQQDNLKKKLKKTDSEPRSGSWGIPEVTYGKNADIPAASAALRLCFSPQKGRYMEATRNIKIGSVLIVEEPYAWALSREAMAQRCLHCCRLVPAPIPCTQCSTVSYCSEDCRDTGWQDYHRFECHVLHHLLSAKELSKMALLVYRIAVTAFARADPTSGDGNLSQKSSAHERDSTSTESDPRCDYPSSVNSPASFPFLSSDYASVHGQVTNSGSRTPADKLKRATSAFFLMKCLRHVAQDMTDDVEMTTSLLRHLQSCSCNAYQITEHVVPDGDVRNATQNELGGGAYPTVSLCNHSCNPNVARHSIGRLCIVRAIRNIRKGDEILDNYGPHFLSHDLEERQKYLETQYFFRCICEACSEKWPTADRLHEKVTGYKCIHCSMNIGLNLLNLKTCPHCKKKCDYGKIAKRLRVLAREYDRALEDLLHRRLHECLKTCVEYCDVMDSVVVHPNKGFVKCQQAVSLCWSLLGNTNATRTNLTFSL
ncbi:SET and MYND domain-containing protein 4-like isoform X2 [Zootermopsis nevadensis]|uniref:SET and MYND domain-containing protein 4-like isoform X2 n=1 Tax=Zootermopsis nevadensis TaxID=136037 RepID=UPI000B8E4B59|nr:SET and MYND domain-containing protein 4-like isoform X2 [Zootermopsis nevadensis]